MNSRQILTACAAITLGLTTLACNHMKQGEEDDEAGEIQVKFTDLPAAVQATINRESNNASIDTVDKEPHNGHPVFEADSKLDGKNYEIKVAEDGTLVSKKLDMEAGEKKWVARIGERASCPPATRARCPSQSSSVESSASLPRQA